MVPGGAGFSIHSANFLSEAVPEGQVRRPGGLRGQRLKALEDENGKLKRLLANAMLDDAGLKDLLAKQF